MKPPGRIMRNLFFAALVGGLLLMTTRGAQAEPEPVWLDVDCSAGIFTKDVDDGLALVQAFRSPELEVRGVSVVYGNASLEACLPITRELTEAYGPEGMGVRAGAAGPEDLGKTTDAVEGLAEALEAGPMTILALGPLTTIATLVETRPDLLPRIRRIIMVAGRRPGQHFQTGTRDRAPLSDFNFERDPQAVQRLLDVPVKLVLAPWEVSSRLWIYADDLDVLEASGGSGAWIAEKSRPWLLLWQRVFHAEGFNPFDTLAVGYATHPELFESFEGCGRIEEAIDDVAAYDDPENTEKRKPYFHVTPCETDHRLTYVHTVEADRFKPVLLERLAGRGGAGPEALKSAP